MTHSRAHTAPPRNKLTWTSHSMHFNGNIQSLGTWEAPLRFRSHWLKTTNSLRQPTSRRRRRVALWLIRVKSTSVSHGVLQVVQGSSDQGSKQVVAGETACRLNERWQWRSDRNVTTSTGTPGNNQHMGRIQRLSPAKANSKILLSLLMGDHVN